MKSCGWWVVFCIKKLRKKIEKEFNDPPELHERRDSFVGQSQELKLRAVSQN